MKAEFTIALSEAGGLTAFIPAIDAQGGHHIEVPLTLAGLTLLKNMLQSREADMRRARHAAKIANRGAMTQQMVDAWLKENKTKVSKVVKPARVVAQDVIDLDLDLDGIEF